MTVDLAEVELAGDQEDDGFDRGDAREAARAARGDLKQAVEGLQKPMVLAPTEYFPGVESLLA